jgi:sugar fermentation stimulation protein A
MKIPEPRQHGSLVKRYKRFLADIRLSDGSIITVHCPNTGSMKGCSTPGSEVVISRSANPNRKYAWTLEMIRANNCWVGVNTSMTNKLIQEGLESGVIDDFGQIDSIQAEVKVSDKSRLDFLVQAGGKKSYIEVKNCSLAENSIALFPDAVTSRGTKHLLELDRLRKKGFDTAVIFCVQRADARSFMPAQAIDPKYTETLFKVYNNGVRVLAYQADVRPDAVTIARKIPVFDTGHQNNNATF